MPVAGRCLVETEAAAPLIFLDIDGVLNFKAEQDLEAAPLANLKHIGEATGARVVLSSDWRRDEVLRDRAATALAELGMAYVGDTPQRRAGQPLRPLEILAWLDSHSGGAGRAGRWVAIDDRHLHEEVGGTALLGHFVQADPSAGGLTRDAAAEAICILLGGGGGGGGGGGSRQTQSRRRSRVRVPCKVS